jgi:hypothetical protein
VAITANQATISDWNVSPFMAPDGRNYDFIVDRSQQVWWGPRSTPADVSSDPAALTPAGFTGRWGPRVTSDPNNRRAGGKCPNFLLMFLQAIAVKLTQE